MNTHSHFQAAPTFHSRAIKKARKENTQRFHFEESAKFRNPILGIEDALEEKLKKNEMLFRGSSSYKKNLLIDALEDLSLTNYGFADQFKYVISFWRKPISENMEIKLNVSDHDIEDAQKQLDELKAEDQELDISISNLIDEINQVDQEINDIKQKTEEAERKVFLNSNRFAKMRMTNDSITDVQNKYNQMFISPFKPKYFPENQKYAEENDQQIKNLARLHSELRISNQITNHLKSLYDKTDKK